MNYHIFYEIRLIKTLIAPHSPLHGTNKSIIISRIHFLVNSFADINYEDLYPSEKFCLTRHCPRLENLCSLSFVRPDEFYFNFNFYLNRF